MNEERLKIIIKTILKIAIFLMAALVVFIIFSSLVMGYDEVIAYFLTKYDKLHKLDQFKQLYLTKSRFFLIQALLTALFLFLIFLMIKAEKFSHFVFTGIRSLYRSLSEFYSNLKQSFKELPLSYKWVGLILFVISFVSKLYYVVQFPLTEDEVFSYVYLVDKGFLVSATYYPGPNNHILYSLSCVFIDLFLDSPRLIMRLPALIVSLFLPFLLFYFLKKLTYNSLAFLSSALTLFSYPIIHYSVHGRGYILVITLTVITLFSGVIYLKTQQVRWLILSGLSSVLGFYAIPIFLYPFVSIYSGLIVFVSFKKDYKQLKNILYVLSIAILFTGLLYSPVILLNGVNAITNNSWVVPMNMFIFLKALPYYIGKIYLYLGFTHSLLPLNIGLILMIIGGYFLIKLDKHLAYLILFLFFIPVLILFIQRVQPFERVWTYMIPFMVIFISESLIRLVNFIIPLKTVLLMHVVTLVFILYSGYIIESRIREGFPYYENISNFEDYFNKTPVNSYLVTDQTYHLFVRYFALLQGKSINISSEFSDKDNFDMLVFPDAVALPASLDAGNYKLSYSNNYIRVYLRK